MTLLSGEAGIGKTSLSLEALAQLEENGWSTHVGYCIEFVDSAIPFGPIISILRSVLLDNLDQVDELIGHRREDLAGLLPELTDADQAGPTSLVGDVDRLFDAITFCLASAAKRRPLALLVEDIHWADAATRDLITSLVRNLGPARILLVVTERSGALTRRHPLRTWLAEHRRMHNVHYLALEGLTEDDVAQHAESVLQEPADPSLVAELLARTGGNPYYCHELLVARRDGNQALPSSLADFLTSRLERLADDERDVLRALAVAAEPVSHRMLTAMMPDRPVGELVRSLFDAAILVLDGSDYAFDHALLREAILRDLLPFEQEELHRRVAEAITADPQRGDSLSDLVSLAMHWAGANDTDRSLAAAVAASRAAASVAAYESAADLALQAFTSWPNASAPEEATGLTRDQLLLQAVAWLASCYRGDEAIAHINEALAGWAGQLPAARRALLIAKMAPIYWDLGNPPEAHRVIDEARRIVPDEVSPEVAQVHHRMAKQAVSDGQIEPARESAERVIAIASVVGPKVELVEAMATMALATGVTGDLAGGLELAAESRELALEAGLVSQVANTYRTEMLIIVFQAGRTEECLEASRRGLAYAEQHCGPRWRADFRLDLCLSYVEAGRLKEAEPHLEILLASEFDDLRRLTVLQAAGLHAMARDSLDEASDFLTSATEIASRYQSAQETGAQMRLLAELARRQGRLLDAGKLIDDALEFQLAEDNLTYTRESIVEKLRIVTESITLGQAGVDKQLTEARALVADFEGSGPANVALRALMDLQLDSIDGTIDPEQANATVKALCDIGYLVEAAEASLLSLAHSASDSGVERAELESAFIEVHDLATTHGMASVRKRLVALARTVKISLSDDAESLAPMRAVVPDYPHFLTKREVEVMAVLAEGLTNKGIGERLFVSPRTVSTHISNVLAKLGVATRGEAAAAYHRLGLAEIIDLRDTDSVERSGT